MADISKCSGLTCPVKKTCWRYVAMPKEFWQSWLTGEPERGKECDHYWHYEPDEIQKEIVND